MNTEIVTPTVLAGIAGFVLSMLFEYFPGLSKWYNGLKNNYQRMIMIGAIVLVAAAIFGLNCSGWFAGKIPIIPCNEKGLEELLWMVLVTAATNQTTHRLLWRKDDVE